MPLSPQQNQLLARIREMLDRTDTIVFVGSGISRWSGLPTWGGLIEELVNYIETQGQSAEIVRKELKANDLLQAASYGIDLLTKPQFAEFMRSACRVDTSVPHEIHKEIISLGSSCFITTNYDQLLEQSHSKWQPDKHLRIVSNNQLIETANIIQAKSSQFIFKPHGDINDSESLILSREHYRKLTGEKLHVLKALETLLASRPVIFLGFGLRDLDFLYIKDLLANIYKGGAMDHYAIMANISEQEITYWRKNFGIHILPYSTSENESGHQPLLDILQELNNVARKNVAGSDSNNKTSAGFTPDKILAIARYSANIVHSTAIKSESHIPLRVSLKKKHELNNVIVHYDTFDSSEAERFLELCPKNVLLIGNPGSGKSYSLRRVLYKLAQTLQNSCLQNEFETEAIVFPIYLDLKLYDGDIFDMINQILPPDFSLEYLTRFKKIRFYLDSYNELPNIYIDNGKFQGDLEKLLAKFDSSTMIIASRFPEGLSALNYPIYQIENIDFGFIEKQLKELDFQIPNRFRREIINLLQKPLFYQMYQEQKVVLAPNMTPVDVYKSFIERMSSELNSITGMDIPLDDLLKPLAYEILNNGIETFNLSDLETILVDYFLKIKSDHTKLIDITNWLISQNFLVAASNLRLSFFHQSITEYFAALKLSEKYYESPAILDEILKFTRWDQCLYLTLSFLNEEGSNRFIQKVIATDLLLAIRASKYLEFNRDGIISQILTTFTNISKQNKDLELFRESIWALSELPVTKSHKKLLYDLLKVGGNIGGAASKLLVDILDKDVKDDLIKELFSHHEDFNYCRDLGSSLSPILDFSDFQIIFNKVGEINPDDSDDDTYGGFFYGLQNSVANLGSADLLGIFREWRKYTSVQVDLICEILQGMKVFDQSLEILVDMVTSGVKKAIFPLYLRTYHPDDDHPINWSLYNSVLINTLIDNLDDSREIGEWALSCIYVICENKKDLLEVVSERMVESTGIKKIALLSCLPERRVLIWKELDHFSNLPPSDIENEPLFLFQQIDIDWKSHENTLIDLLQLDNIDLVFSLLENIFMNSNEINSSLDLDVKPIPWWFEWMKNISERKADKDRTWFILDRISTILPKRITEKSRNLILDEFNKPNSQYRSLIKEFLLRNIPELSFDVFTEEAISFLISDLNKKKARYASFTIGMIATEQFVEKHLIPLLVNKSEPFQSNLREAIDFAGKKNNRRFLVG